MCACLFAGALVGVVLCVLSLGLLCLLVRVMVCLCCLPVLLFVCLLVRVRV